MPLSLRADARKRIIELYLDGKSRRAIEAAVGASNRSISNFLEKERRRNPDLEDLRLLKRDIKSMHVPYLDVVRVVRIVRSLEESKVDLDEEELKLIIAITTKSHGGVLSAIDALQEIKSLGKPEIGSIKNALATAKTSFDERPKPEPTSTAPDSSAPMATTEQESLRALKSTLEISDIKISDLREFINLHQGLRRIGFTTDVAILLASELRKHDLSPFAAASIVAEMINNQRGKSS